MATSEMPEQIPRVSVIMPLFNCAPFVEDAIRSVCCQTESDFELIVVDDGSTDGGDQIVAKLAETDCRIRLFKQAKSGRPANARNTGGRHARGQFIAFQDADDLAHPNKFHRELQVLTSFPDVEVVFADLQKFSSMPDERIGWLAQDRFVTRAGNSLMWQSDRVYLSNARFYAFMSAEVTGMNVQTAIIRRSALEAEPYWFDESTLVGEDADLFFRLASRCRIAFIDEVLGYYRQRSGSVSQDQIRRLDSEIGVYARNLARARPFLTKKELAGCHQQIASRYRELGRLRYVNHEIAAARQAYVAAWRIQPKAEALFGLVKTWMPSWLIGLLRDVRRFGRGVWLAPKQS
jgi:GT2 family glycosyltransferase